MNNSLSGLQVYLVGGAVRDRLLGLPIRERDWVVVGSSSEAMLERGFIQVGRGFPVFLHPVTKEEYALARTERKVGVGYRGFGTSSHPAVTLNEDLRRRDLTINAIAEDKNGHIVDPFCGIRDIQKRKLRHVSPAFVEDPVRVLRLARFASRFFSLEFSIDKETLNLARHITKSGELDALVANRVIAEMEKSLQGPNPSVFFSTLKNTYSLARVMPEIHDTMADACLCMRIFRALDASQNTFPPRMKFSILGYFAAAQKKTLLSLCKRMSLPSSWQHLCTMIENFGHRLPHSQHFSPHQWVDFMTKIDALRNPKNTKDFLEVCTLCDKGSLVGARIAECLIEKLRLANNREAISQLPSAHQKDPKHIKHCIRQLHCKIVEEVLKKTFDTTKKLQVYYPHLQR